MSDTPRTNAELVWATSGTGEDFQCVDKSFARELERENNELRAKLRSYINSQSVAGSPAGHSDP